MALWSNKTVQVPGLTATYASSGPITAESRRHYILDTTSNAITVNLPSGIDGYSIRISDAKGTFLTNNVIVVPSTGQKINNLTINESLLLDVNEMWIELTWNALAGSWILNAPGVLGLIADSFSDYPYITSPASPAASTLRLYAKSDGKLYTKDSAGSEQKVGGGLDHPTSGSTFEGGTANPSMTGTSNTAIGVNAGNLIINASSGTFIGAEAGTSVTTGNNNTAVGRLALSNTQSGFNNVAVGAGSFLNITNGANNVGIGSFSAQSFVGSSSFNTIIGTSGSATAMTRSGTVAIGRDSTGNEAHVTADNQFVLGALNHLYHFPGVAQTSLVLGPTGTSTGQTGVIRVRELAANGTNSIGIRAPDNIAADVTLTLPAADGTNGQLLTTDGAGVLSWSTVSASNSTILVTQNSHGFVAADVGTPLYLNGSTYTFAQADTEAKAEVAGIINSIVDTNNFRLCLAGEVSSVGANLLDTAITTKIIAASDHNAVFVSGTTIYVGLGSGLAISTNGGTTWTIKTTSDGLASNGVQGVFVSGNNIYLATANGLSISTNGGTTWTTTFSGSNVKGVFASGSTIYAARMGGAGLSISTDGGSTWVTRTTANGLGSSWVQAVYAVGSTVYAATEGGFSISTDGGSTFVNKTTANGLGSDVTLALYVIDTTVYVGTSAGLSISTNSGLSFVNKTTANGLGSNVIRGVTASGSMIYAATDGGLSISSNGGSSFVNKTTADGLATISATSVSIFNNIVYATTGGGGGGLSSFVASALPTSSALVAGEMYFLSAFIAGKITATPPSVVGQISKPVGIARTSSALDFFNMRGSAVGGTNVYTQIGLTNNAVTTIQNAAAYDSVELSGWVYINATTPLRFAIKVQVTKNGAGNNYLTSFQTSGDTPPSGFDVDATAAGLVQVTLPSIAGFTSAVVQFSLNGPAVGASLPLQIQSSLITVNAGIQFPATMIPSADPNNLDDYEENVWAPSIYGGSTAGTWTPNATQTGGYYIKIGKLVYLFINLNGTLSGAAGALQIGNLPFPRATPNAANGWNATYSAFTMAYGSGLIWTAGHYCTGWLVDPNGFLYGHTMPTGGGIPGNVPVTNAALNIHITGAYYTN